MQIAKFFFKVLIATIILWLLIQQTQINFQLIADVFQNPGLFCVVIGLFLLMIMIASLRWYLLNLSQGFKFTYIQTLLSTYVGAAFNILLPGAIGGDFVRFHFLTKKNNENRSKILLSILFDRIIGFVGVVCIVILAITENISLLYTKDNMIYLILLSIGFCFLLIGGVAGFILIAKHISIPNLMDKYFKHRLLKPFLAFWVSIKEYQFKLLPIIKCIILSVAIQILMTWAIMIIAYLMGLPPIPFSHYAITIGITQIVNLIPLTPGGIGIGELAFANILILLNPQIHAPFATVFLTYRLLSMASYLPGIMGYLPSFFAQNEKKSVGM